MRYPMWWAFDWLKESDWVLGDTITVEKLPQAPLRFEDVWRDINQDDIAPNICTICNAWWAVSDVTGYIPTEDDILEVMNIGINDYEWKYQFDPSVWRYLHLAVDEVRRSANRKGLDVSSISVRIGSPEYYMALRKGYTVATGYKGNRAYNIDRDDDGIVSEWWVNEPFTYWHANGQFEYETESLLFVRDSYAGRDTNIYMNEALDRMIEANRQFIRWFIFFPEYIMTPVVLPPHISIDSVTWDDRDIVIARETEVAKAMQTWYKPKFKNYLWTRTIERMLIELALLR